MVRNVRLLTTIVAALVGLTFEGGPVGKAEARSQPISNVDTSLAGSERYVLRVLGKPFYPIEIQVRLDKLRYAWGWDERARDAIIARAAADGFNTVSIPIQWYEVEPTKDHFDWRVLDEYLELATRHGLKLELLWFGANSGGHVQWLGNPKTNPVHLRTPDYVLHSPDPTSNNTTSEFTIRRDMSAYTLDLADQRLRARETFVLGKVMAHVSQWDASHGSPGTLVGVQLGNEVRGINRKAFPPELIVNYISAVGSAVKQSAYVVWTRLNCVYVDLLANLEANQKLRQSLGTNLDFVGIDTYRHHFKSDQAFIASMASNIPVAQGNYRMIMEVSGEFPNAPGLQLSALSGGNALDYYDMIGPDAHGMYDRVGTTGFQPHGSYVEDVRLLNRLLDSDIADVATKTPGQDLFVHNATGSSTDPSTGARGIVFTPAVANSRAISISRARNEVVLMNTRGGTFQLPQTIHVVSATRGYFNREDSWVGQGDVPVAGGLLRAPEGATILVVTDERH